MITVYSASAGSGKTYTLTREYLCLALGDDYRYAYKRILAVTFTNKATAEMKQRILRELNSMKASRVQAGSMGDEICHLLDISPEELQKRAGELHFRILHDYSGFAVSTLDAFFQKIVRNFTREAGLQAGFRLELNVSFVLEEVTRQVLGRLGTPGFELLDEWVLSMAEEKVEQGDRWDFRQDIIHLGKELFRENLMRKEEALDTLNAGDDTFREQRNRLFQSIALRENELSSLAQNLLDALGNLGVAPNDLAYGASGLGGYLQKIANKVFDFPGSRTLEAAENPEKWVTKTSSHRASIIPHIQANLGLLLQNLISYIQEKLPELNTLIEIRNYLNILGLVSFIREELKLYRQEKNIMLLPDTTLLLFKIIRENDTSFIYEKAGNYFENFLIDEFQDTSRTQWDNFQPLIRNSLASGKKSLLVGDVKQAIYRWRDGDWKLLYGEFQKGIHADQIKREVLRKNHRSLPGIIRTNNRIFSTLPLLAIEDLQNILPDTLPEKNQWLQEISGLFQDAEQEVPEHKLQHPEGYAAFHCLEQAQETDEDSGEGLGWKERSLQVLHDRILELKALGFRYADMAILTRKKSEGTEILNYLQFPGDTRETVPATSSEALMLGSGIGVRMLIQALRMLLHSNDDPARAALSISLLYGQNPDAWIQNWSDKRHEILPEILWNEHSRARLRKLPLFDLFHTLLRLLGLDTHSQKHETAFLAGFMDAVLEFMKEDNPDADRFLEWWEEKGQTRAVQMPDGLDAVRILTIHKSKGLEFPVVLIPFCDWDIIPGAQMAPLLWCEPVKTGLSKIPLAPVRYKQALGNTAFRNAYFDELRLNYADNLNLLYVAFTRAEKVLICNLPVLTKKDGSMKKGRMASLLYPALIALQMQVVLEGQEEILYSGNLHTLQITPALQEESIQELHMHSEDWMNRLRVKKLARSLPLPQQQGGHRQYGVLVHNLLENIHTLQDAETALNQMLFSGTISESEKTNLRARLDLLFHHSKALHWFDGTYEVRTESDILDIEGKHWRPDRIMKKDNAIHIVDFKTGKHKPEYIQQIQNYAGLFSQMGYSVQQASLVYIAEDAVEFMEVSL